MKPLDQGFTILNLWLWEVKYFLFLSGFLLLSILCCFLTSYFTYLTAQSFFNDKKASLLAAIFVVALPTPTLATSTFTTYESILTPTALIFPLLVMAFYFFFEKRWIIIPLALVGVASLFQVLYGLTGGLLIIGAYLGSGWLFNWRDYPVKKLLIGIPILGVFAMANLYPYFTSTVSESINSAEFVNIVAYFRNPHHYVPTQFPILDWVLSAFFFGAFIYALVEFYRQSRTDAHHFQVTLIIIALVMGFVIGYVFVEVFPNRFVTTAQTFRYIILLKWLACFYLAEWLMNDKWRLLSSVHPVSLIINVILEKSYFDTLQKYRLPIVLILAALALVFLRIQEDIRVLVAIFLIVVFLIYMGDWAIFKNDREKWTTIGLGGVTFLLAITPFISQNLLPSSVDNLLEKVYPKYNLAYKYDDDLKELSTIIAEKTPEDAVLITPPNLPQIRFSANRAIVVDFKSFPYQDDYMLEWKERMLFCYGESDKLGFKAQEDLTKKFMNVSLEHLQEIKTKYQASFAVVDDRSPISEGVIFENDSYKLIELK